MTLHSPTQLEFPWKALSNPNDYFLYSSLSMDDTKSSKAYNKVVYVKQ